MNEMEDKKYANNENKVSICVVCLSSNRNLTRIHDIDQYIDVFTDATNIALTELHQVWLCWECTAILIKIKDFKYRIQCAQTILRCGVLSGPNTSICLSRLSINKLENDINITYDDSSNDNDEKPLCEIKQEINPDNNYLDNSNTPSNHGNDHQNKIKKRKLKNKTVKRNKHYIIVYGGAGVYKKSLITKKFQLKPEEVLLWLENERGSDFYKDFKFKCDFCFHGFNCKEKLIIHNLENHDISLGTHVCPTCQTRFPSAQLLSTHLRTHTFAHSCLRCDYKCYTTRRLYAHIETHRMVECVYCRMTFENIRLFHDHYTNIHSVFLCDHCGKRCSNKYALERHMSIHTSKYTCKECTRSYQSSAALKKHRATKHNRGRAEDAYCVPCNKQFESEPVYRRHILNTTAHARENKKLSKKTVSCPQCSNTYTRHSYMMNHYRYVHERQSKHYCTQCDKHFLNRTRYVEHMRFNHEGVQKEKNKICNECGRGFATNRILMNHMRTHSGERPYECEHCSATFTQKHSMVSHVKFIHQKNNRRPWRQTSRHKQT